jgi:diguanylate cyclase (GGDEF)-like protein
LRRLPDTAAPDTAAATPQRRWWFSRAAAAPLAAFASTSAGAGAGEREALLAALFDATGDALLVCAADGRVLDCNGSAATMLKTEAVAIIGRGVSRWVAQGTHADRFGLQTGDAEARIDGTMQPVTVQVTPFDAPDGRRFIVRLGDGSERAQTRQRLERLANYDALTGLPNRSLFRERLGQAMARARRYGKPMALLFLDLDRFKTVNDALGHEVGDRLLKHATAKLTGCLRASDVLARDADATAFPPPTLSRLGGDEFTVILEAVGSAEDAAHVARRMLEALAEPFVVGEEEIVSSASIGISMYPTDDVDLDGLIRHTDMAMYRSKSLGRGTYSFFSDELNSAVASRVSLEGHLRRAVERQEFVLHYQPKADLRSGKVSGVEALIRWHRPGHGIVPPDRFVDVLEDTGLILPVGAWVVRAACEQLAAWDRLGLPPLRMAVNLSARQFRHLYLASLVGDSLRENSIDPQRLEIELTESLLMEDNDNTRSMLEGFRRMGVRLALDDFGTGHSSLTYLKRFAVDTLKIDRSFVQSLPGSEEDMAICAAVIALGRSMKMDVVAEGVESAEQAAALREMGCHEVQGYWLGRPMVGSAMPAWLLEHKRVRARTRQRRTPTESQPMTLFSLLDEA